MLQWIAMLFLVAVSAAPVQTPATVGEYNFEKVKWKADLNVYDAMVFYEFGAGGREYELHMHYRFVYPLFLAGVRDAHNNVYLKGTGGKPNQLPFTPLPAVLVTDATTRAEAFFRAQVPGYVSEEQGAELAEAAARKACAAQEREQQFKDMLHTLAARPEKARAELMGPVGIEASVTKTDPQGVYNEIDAWLKVQSGNKREKIRKALLKAGLHQTEECSAYLVWNEYPYDYRPSGFPAENGFLILMVMSLVTIFACCLCVVLFMGLLGFLVGWHSHQVTRSTAFKRMSISP
jgi:hypothetical protein